MAPGLDPRVNDLALQQLLEPKSVVEPVFWSLGVRKGAGGPRVRWLGGDGAVLGAGHL